LLDSFWTEHPELKISTEQLIDSLRICEMHELELEPVDVPVFRGCLDYAPEYVDEMVARFPHSTLGEVMVSESYTDNTVTIWVCSVCDDVRNSSKWGKR